MKFDRCRSSEKGWLLVISGLLDDLFQEVDIIAKGQCSGVCQRESREHAPVLDCFCDGDIACLLESSDVSGDIAIGHFQNVTQLREREPVRRSQRGHDGQPSFFMYDAVEL